jgi:hypothetical protein
MKNPTFFVSVGKDFWVGDYTGSVDSRGFHGAPTRMDPLPFRNVTLDCSLADAWRLALKMTAVKIVAFLKGM